MKNNDDINDYIFVGLVEEEFEPYFELATDRCHVCLRGMSQDRKAESFPSRK